MIRRIIAEHGAETILRLATNTQHSFASPRHATYPSSYSTYQGPFTPVDLPAMKDTLCLRPPKVSGLSHLGVLLDSYRTALVRLACLPGDQ